MQNVIVGLLLMIIIILAACLIWFYSALINKKNRVEERWAYLSLKLSKMDEWIRVYVKLLLHFADHKQENRLLVLQAEYEFVNVQSYDEFMKAYQDMNRILTELLAVNAELSPEIRINPDLILLQNELKELKDSMEKSSQAYNEAVLVYNSLITSIPSRAGSMILGITEMPYRQIDGLQDK